MTAAIEPEKILSELHNLWDQLDREHPDSVLRACAMTLLVTAQDDKDAEEARRTLGVLMHDHPARAVVLRTQDGAEPSARVFAECWKPFGGSQQICAEGVEIIADAVYLPDIAPLLVPLCVADLPVVLWCRGPAAFSLRAYDTLFPLSDKIVFDSSTVSGAAAALAFLRSLRARGMRVADLHWTRLTGWREIVAHLFDDRALVPADVSSARIAYGGASVTTCVLYFAAWIGRALPSARIVLESQPGDPGLRGITLSSAAGALSLARSAPGCVEVSGFGRGYRCSLPPRDEEALMREELNLLGPDPVYERVLG